MDESEDVIMEDDGAQDFWISDRQRMNVYTTPAPNPVQYIRVPDLGMVSWKDVMSKFSRHEITYRESVGPANAIRIETAVFEYPLLGAYCWIQIPSFWDELKLKLYPGSAATFERPMIF